MVESTFKKPHELLEEKLKTHFDTPNVVACSSGTAALHLALEALQLEQGSEVILPNYTMVACARAVTLAGLTPVFADSLSDLTIDPESVRKLITRKTKAIMAVHIYGRMCDMKSLRDLSTLYDLFLVEDSAEAHGANCSDQADLTCWSFYQNKVIHGEEGGAVGCWDEEFAQRIRKLRCLGFDDEHTYQHEPRGHNYRMSSSHANLILQSLANYQTEKDERVESYTWWEQIVPRGWPAYRLNQLSEAPWVFPLFVGAMRRGKNRIVDRDLVGRFVKHLRQQGLEARLGFQLMSNQLEYKHCVYEMEENYAFVASNTLMYLPLLSATLRTEEMKDKWAREFSILIEEVLKNQG